MISAIGRSKLPRAREEVAREVGTSGLTFRSTRHQEQNQRVDVTAREESKTVPRSRGAEPGRRNLIIPLGDSLTWSFPVPGDHRLPAHWMQPGCTLCFFAVWGESKEKASLDHRDFLLVQTQGPVSSDRIEKVIYLMKKTRPSRVTP